MGQITVGQITVGQITVGQRTVGQLTVGQITVGQITVGQRTVGQRIVGQRPVGSYVSSFFIFFYVCTCFSQLCLHIQEISQECTLDSHISANFQKSAGNHTLFPFFCIFS